MGHDFIPLLTGHGGIPRWDTQGTSQEPQTKSSYEHAFNSTLLIVN